MVVTNMIVIDFQSMADYHSFKRVVGQEGYIKEIEDDLVQVIFDSPSKEFLEALVKWQTL